MNHDSDSTLTAAGNAMDLMVGALFIDTCRKLPNLAYNFTPIYANLVESLSSKYLDHTLLHVVAPQRLNC